MAKERTKKQPTSETKKETKKPFDKKRYRLQKYSNKYKVSQWEERRKKAVLREYYKELSKDERNAQTNLLTRKNNDERDNDDAREPQKSPKKKPNAFYKAKQEYLRKKDEKRIKREEALRIKSEREEALKKYKEKRTQTFKKLSKKTKKGQPVMKDRLEMLLEKIQNTVS